LHKNALSQKRSEYRPLGWKNFGECSIRLRWGSQNLGSFLLQEKPIDHFDQPNIGNTTVLFQIGI
jgi:hypothetical protein